MTDESPDFEKRYEQCFTLAAMVNGLIRTSSDLGVACAVLSACFSELLAEYSDKIFEETLALHLQAMRLNRAHMTNPNEKLN